MSNNDVTSQMQVVEYELRPMGRPFHATIEAEEVTKQKPNAAFKARERYGCRVEVAGYLETSEDIEMLAKALELARRQFNGEQL